MANSDNDNSGVEESSADGTPWTRQRSVKESEDWIFSLTPISVAFVFYILFIVSTDVEQKGLYIAIGIAAGLIGLESYWIMRGWTKKNMSTVIMGVLGVVVVLGLLGFYMSVA